MKPRDVHRAVKPQRFERSAGDAPSLGRVARVPGTGMPKPSSGRRRRSRRTGEGWSDRRGKRESEARRRVIWAWSAVLTLAAFVAIAVFFINWTFGQMDRRNQIAKKQVKPGQTIVKSRFPSPSEDDALNHVKRALALRDPVMIPSFFHTGSAKPEEVIEFLTKLPDLDGQIENYQWLSSMDANGLLIDGVLVNSLRDDKPCSRLVQLTPDETGRWKIDFPAFARMVSRSWEELLAADAASAEAEVRVLIAPDSYYNGPFSNEKDWICYGMLSPDSETVMLGYCRRGSPQALAMEQMFLKSSSASQAGANRLLRACLRIQRVEGAETRQFEITRVLSEDWIVREPALDGQPL